MSELNRNNSLYGTTFCGKEASIYAKQYGYLDYHTFASAFDAILNNSIMQETTEKGYEWEPVTGCGPFYYDENGDEVNEDFYWENQDTCYEEYPDVYQQFIVSDYGAELIQQYGVGGLWYCEELDIYLWDISHWGTSWDYVLTDIHLNAGEAAFREGAGND